MRNLKTLALIPARGGSKGVPGKNYKMFNNKPLIVWTMDFIKSLNFIDYSVVSSDSNIIQDIASKENFNFLKRPKTISHDSSLTEDCIFHVINKFAQKKIFFENILLFEPTTPLRRKETVEKIYNFFLNSKFNSIFTVSLCDKLIGKIKIQKFKSLSSQKRRRQEREKIFYETGVVYMFKTQNFVKTKKIVDKHSFPFVVDKLESMDINDILDFEIIKFIHSKNRL